MVLDPPLTFGDFRLDPASGQLYGKSGPLSLTPKALSLLEYLAKQPGRLVTKKVAGSGLKFTDRGTHALSKGQKGWRVYAAHAEH